MLHPLPYCAVFCGTFPSFTSLIANICTAITVILSLNNPLQAAVRHFYNYFYSLALGLQPTWLVFLPFLCFALFLLCVLLCFALLRSALIWLCVLPSTLVSFKHLQLVCLQTITWLTLCDCFYILTLCICWALCIGA